MNSQISPNTQAILLITAPLIVGRAGQSSEFLTHGEYNRLARILRENQCEPADLLGTDANNLIEDLQGTIDSKRLTGLLARGFLLSQAIEKWQTRAIWVVSRADSNYPRRLKERLKEAAPVILYGCGDATIMDKGGLAVVGSRQVDNSLIEYTENIGGLAAESCRTVVSGGARGIDLAAMYGALKADGHSIGVLADSLERLVLAREVREYLMNEQLVLISPYDPAAGFNVGHAMERNKLIYALADAALVVRSDYEKGGTWAGAVEQLKKLHFVPVYVRPDGNNEKGLAALIGKGALPWPNPRTPEEFEALANPAVVVKEPYAQKQLPLSIADKQNEVYNPESDPTVRVSSSTSGILPSSSKPENDLYEKLKQLLPQLRIPKTDVEVANELQITKSLAKELLSRLAREGILKRMVKPVRYFVPSNKQESLFKTN